MSNGVEIVRVFGPVPSRRLGRSLGLDLTPPKTCTYNCLYCQLPPTNHHTIERNRFFTPEELLDELEKVLSAIEPPDWITCSGTGEPTLYSELGILLRSIKEKTSIPTCVITNGSLLWMEDVRADLCFADRVMPTLTTVNEQTWRKIHRPAAGLSFSKVLSGLRAFGEMYPGTLELEIFICPGLNDTEQELTSLETWLKETNGLDAIYLNAAVRSPIESTVKQADERLLNEIRRQLRLKIPITTVYEHSPLPRRVSAKRSPTGQEILELLKRHPCTLEQLHRVYGGDVEKLQEITKSMVDSHIAVFRPDGTLAPVKAFL